MQWELASKSQVDTKPQSEASAATLPLVNIVGEKVALGPQGKYLSPLFARWFNDFRTLSRLGDTVQPWTTYQEEQWNESVATRKESEIEFAIYELSSGRPIGVTGIGVDYRNRTAEYGIIIGEPDARGKGYGTETTQLMLDYAFTALGLHNVKLTVHAYNLAGIRAYTKAGFKQYGRRREKILMGGKRWDEIHMECLSTEWGPSPVLAEVFQPDEPLPIS